MSKASDDLGVLNGLLADPTVVNKGGGTYKGKFVSFAELVKKRDAVDKVVTAENKSSSKNKKDISDAQKSVATSLARLNDYLNGNAAAQSRILPGVPRDKAIEQLRSAVNTSVVGLKSLSPNDPILVKAGLAQATPAATTGGAGLRGGTQDVVPAEVKFRAPKVTRDANGKIIQVSQTGGTQTGGTQTTTTGTDDARKTFIDSELAKRGLIDNDSNRKKLGVEYDKSKQPVSAELTPAIEEAFRTKYPQYAWMLTDLDRDKYSDMFQLIAEASNPLKEMGAEEFKRRFEGTSFTQELSLKRINRELIGGIGSFSWGSGQLGKFLNKANQYGYTGDALKQAAYQELLVKDPATGAYKNPNAVNEVRASSPYLRLKKIGTAYLSPLSDDRIIESLTGGISEDDVLRISREKAIALYPHLTRQIEAGLTLSDLAYDYQRTAADLLELTPDQIDMSKGKFNLALKTGEGGKERMMSTSEWIQSIKSDADFGWQYTKQANDQATNVALNIAKAFGKVQ
jgi:hypothetical protein